RGFRGVCHWSGGGPNLSEISRGGNGIGRGLRAWRGESNTEEKKLKSARWDAQRARAPQLARDGSSAAVRVCLGSRIATDRGAAFEFLGGFPAFEQAVG